MKRNIGEEIDSIALWIKDRVEKANAKGVIFGLSGGIDSAVVAGISKKVFPDTSLGVIMPCHSNDRDERDGLLLAKSMDLKTKKVDLTETYDQLVRSLDYSGSTDLALSNIKPRLRMTSLYYLAQEMGYLVLGPTNKSELLLGYFTKHGDSGVDLLPIADYHKSEIYLMAEELNIPEEIIKKKPSAGLLEGQTDEEEMGFSYEELEKLLKNKELDLKMYKRIEDMRVKSSHKREFPAIYRVK